MKICHNCKKEYDNDSLVECPVCGFLLDDEDEEEGEI